MQLPMNTFKLCKGFRTIMAIRALRGRVIYLRKRARRDMLSNSADLVGFPPASRRAREIRSFSSGCTAWRNPGDRAGGRWRLLAGRKNFKLAERGATLQHVAQLSNVAGPVVIDQGIMAPGPPTGR